MKIVIAPDSFKGSLSSAEAASQIGKAIRDTWPSADTVVIPMADGGEGTVDALLAAGRGEKIERLVHDPLGRMVQASYGWLEADKIAVIETASASGLPLLAPGERDPYRSSTYGTGELIAAALERGAEKVIIGLGGSATVDAGTGCMQALGMKFYDSDGKELAACGQTLGLIERIDASGLHPRVSEVEWIVATDVQNTLLGAEGAVYVFGPQKGIEAERLTAFENWMRHYAGIVSRSTGIQASEVPGAGAAGGFAFTLMSYSRPRIVKGFELIAEVGGLEAQVKQASFVITGEGKFDAQSLYGKVPVGIANVARPYGVPVIVIAGTIEGSMSDASRHGIHLAVPIVDDVMRLEDAMEHAAELVYRATVRVLRTFELAWLLEEKEGSV